MPPDRPPPSSDAARGRDGMRVLSSAMREIAEATGDYPRLLEAIARTLADAIGDTCIVLLLSRDERRLELAAVHDRDPAVAEQFTALLGAGLSMDEPSMTRDAIAEGKPVCVPVIDLDELRSKTTAEAFALHRRLGTRGLLVAPLRVRGEVLGSFSVVRHRTGHSPLDALDTELAQDLALHAALALSNARLVAALRDAKTAADASDRELDAFNYSVAHDLRAPLRAIDGFTQAIVEDSAEALDDAGRKHLHRVREAAQKMGALIDGLLALSRMARAELHLEKVDLTALARASFARLQGEEPGRRVTFVAPDGLTATGDARMLGVVLDNLLGNAWKFTSKRGDARIELGAERGQAATFFVRDDGAGFDMTCASRLFGAFQRLHTSAEFEGTGMGLAIVQRIVARHGGRVWAEGTPDGGATFHFTLSDRARA